MGFSLLSNNSPGRKHWLATTPAAAEAARHRAGECEGSRSSGEPIARRPPSPILSSCSVLHVDPSGHLLWHFMRNCGRGYLSMSQLAATPPPANLNVSFVPSFAHSLSIPPAVKTPCLSSPPSMGSIPHPAIAADHRELRKNEGSGARAAGRATDEGTKRRESFRERRSDHRHRASAVVAHISFVLLRCTAEHSTNSEDKMDYRAFLLD